MTSSLFEIIVVRIFPHLNWIRRDTKYLFELNKERHEVSLPIQYDCGKKRTRTTPNTDTFYAKNSVVVNYFSKKIIVDIWQGLNMEPNISSRPEVFFEHVITYWAVNNFFDVLNDTIKQITKGFSKLLLLITKHVNQNFIYCNFSSPGNL